jgi:transposase
VCGKKIHHWYQDYLSGFPEDETLHRHDTEDADIISRKTGKPKTIAVPIFKPGNFGVSMSIDDKNIGGIGYMILRNKETGKIALMIATTKLKLIKKLLQTLPAKISFNVEKVTRDMAKGYYAMLHEVFPRAVQVVDKFHVIKHALDALQDTRIRYRQMYLTKRRQAYDEQKLREKQKKEEFISLNIPYQKAQFRYKEPKYENGETALQLLANSRYLLFKFSKDWDDYSKERATILFREFPEIHKAYINVCQFRIWMQRENIGKERQKLIEELRAWFQSVEESDVEEILNFKSLIERNSSFILNYFISGDTNADAEGLNSQIERFIVNNGGIKNRDFFHFRMKKHFS